MSDPVTYTKLTLTYEIDKLLKQVQLRSIYATKPNEGNLSVTDAELDITNINLRNAANAVYTALQSLTRYNTTPFDYDYSVGGKRMLLYELWMHEHWDAFLQDALSVNIENALVDYCLADWFSMTSHPSAQMWMDRYQQDLKSIKNNINFRKEPTRRPYNYFS